MVWQIEFLIHRNSQPLGQFFNEVQILSKISYQRDNLKNMISSLQFLCEVTQQYVDDWLDFQLSTDN